jgi:predicted adenylyl cyclase CyaB
VIVREKCTLSFESTMPTNIEIKAILTDRAAADRIAARLSDAGPEVIQQEDHFFPCANARLKLRILAPDRGELIRYDRKNLAGARPSDYLIARTTDPHVLLEILTAALGRSGSVKKTRKLYLVGQTRIHLDQVEGLGDFLELEVVLRPGQSEVEGKSIAARLLSEFEITQHQLLADAYIDLLQRRAGQTGS